jgi:hypothetical protein
MEQAAAAFDALMVWGQVVRWCRCWRYRTLVGFLYNLSRAAQALLNERIDDSLAARVWAPCYVVSYTCCG